MLMLMQPHRVAQPDTDLLERVRDAIRGLEPNARLILYGSRARGDAAPDSDWDVLVLLDGVVDSRREAAVKRAVRAVMLELDPPPTFSLTIHTAEEWDSPLFRAMPFHRSVDRDGIDLTPLPDLAVASSDRRVERGRDGEEHALTAERDTLARFRMDEAHDALIAADAMAEIGQWNFCVNRLYYACFYAVNALLVRRGLGSSKHSGVQALFNQHFGKPGLVARDLVDLYNDLFETRQKGDYAAFVRFTAEQVRPLIPEARRFVARVDELLAPPTAAGPDL
jgi:uncharacterized protein